MVKSIIQLCVLVTAVLYFSGCAAEIIKDPTIVREQLVGFNLAVQSGRYDEALELLVVEERNAIMGLDGEVKDKYAQGMKRLNLSTLLSKNLFLVDGKIKGMLNVLEEANRSMIISDEQRSMGIRSSSSRLSSSSFAMPVNDSLSSSSEDKGEALPLSLSSSSDLTSSSLAISSSTEQGILSSTESSPSELLSSSVANVSSSDAEFSSSEKIISSSTESSSDEKAMAPLEPDSTFAEPVNAGAVPQVVKELEESADAIMPEDMPDEELKSVE